MPALWNRLTGVQLPEPSALPHASAILLELGLTG